MKNKGFSILLIIICSFHVNGQDTLTIINEKQKHLYQSESYFFTDLNNNPLDSAFYIIGGVYSNLKYALNDNKNFRLIYPESSVVLNQKNKKYYIIVDHSMNKNEIINSLYRLRSLYEPMAWILVYY